MKLIFKQILTMLFSMAAVLGCSNRLNASTLDENFQSIVPVSDMNKSLEISVDDADKVFYPDIDIPMSVENKSAHFIFFNREEEYMKLFMARGTEWVEVKNKVTYSGSKVLSPQGPPLLNLDYTWARPALDDSMFKDNKTNILIRIVLTGEIMKMDTYSEDWRNHEDKVLTGELVGAYADVYIRP